MDLFITLIVVMVSWQCRYDKIYHIIGFKYVHLLYINYIPIKQLQERERKVVSKTKAHSLRKIDDPLGEAVTQGLSMI